jgi:hypothetical protein
VPRRVIDDGRQRLPQFREAAAAVEADLVAGGVRQGHVEAARADAGERGEHHPAGVDRAR